MLSRESILASPFKYPHEYVKRVSLDDVYDFFKLYANVMPNDIILTSAIERLYFKVDIDTFEKLRKLFCTSRMRLFHPHSYAGQLRRELPKRDRIDAVASLLRDEKYAEVIEAFSKDDERLYSLLCYAARNGLTTLFQNILVQTKVDMRVILTLDDSYVQFAFLSNNRELWELAETEYIHHHHSNHGNFLAEIAFASGNLELVEWYIQRTHNNWYLCRTPSDGRNGCNVSSIYDTRQNLLPIIVFPRSLYVKWRTSTGVHELL